MAEFILQHVEALTVIAVFTWYIAIMVIVFIKEGETLENMK